MKNNENEINEQDGSVTNNPRRRSRSILFRPALWFFLIAVALGVLYFQTKKEMELLKNPEALQAEQAKEVEAVIADMKNHVVIADTEEVKLLGIIENPEIAKKDQPFYSDVEVGDYVFVFTKTSRVLIWRPSTKKIVNFSLFTVQDNATTTAKQAPKPAATTTDTDTDAE